MRTASSAAAPSIRTARSATRSSTGATTTASFAPGLPQDQEAGRGRRGPDPPRDRPLRRQRRARRHEQVRRLLPRRVRLRPADPLRRQGHPHRVLGPDVEGHDQRQRPGQVPDQRARDRQEEEPDPGVPRLLPRPATQHIALRTEDIVGTVRQLRENGIEFLGMPHAYYESLADRVGDVGVPDRHARGAGHRGRPRRGGLPPPDLHPARSRTARRSSSRSSSATARAASASATSRRSSRRSRSSRRGAGTSSDGVSRRPGRGHPARAGLGVPRSGRRRSFALMAAWSCGCSSRCE